MCENIVYDTQLVHENIVSSVKKQMLNDNMIIDVAEIFKLFGDPTRAKIICALSKADMCVCDIANLLSMTSSAISHQLRLLKQGRIVTYHREGKTVIYSLDDEHIIKIFAFAVEHINEERSK